MTSDITLIPSIKKKL